MNGPSQADSRRHEKVPGRPLYLCPFGAAGVPNRPKSRTWRERMNSRMNGTSSAFAGVTCSMKGACRRRLAPRSSRPERDGRHRMRATGLIAGGPRPRSPTQAHLLDRGFAEAQGHAIGFADGLVALPAFVAEAEGGR